MIRSETSTTPPPAAAARKMPPLLPVVIIALIVIVAIATGVGVVDTSGGPTSYACLDIAHQGSNELITTSGLLHYLKSEYYVSCSEGSNLPTNQYKASCLTISPQNVPAAIGSGASTEYYYISAAGNSITLNGAPPPINGTEIITPASISLSVTC
jgi:hypothetical protein